MIREHVRPRADTTGALRFYQVGGDMMDPTIRNRDFVLLAPVNRYVGEGYYLVLNAYGEPVPYSCSAFGGTREKPEIRLHPHNKFYTGSSMPRDKFDERVLGKIVMICKVVDHHLLPSLEGVR